MNAAEMADELGFFLHLGLAHSLLHLLVDQFLQFFSALGSPGQSVVHRRLAHFETFVATLKTSV